MVAEKPSVAKLLAEHLSGGRLRTRRGQSRANQIFEFIKYFGPAQQKCKLMVTSVVGHIYGLNFEVSFVLYPWTLLWNHMYFFESYYVESLLIYSTKYNDLRTEECEIWPSCFKPRP